MSIFCNVQKTKTDVNETATQDMSYSNVRNQAVIDSLQKQGIYTILAPTHNELSYADGRYNSSNLHLMENVTENLISKWGEKSLTEMNKKLSDFMDSMGLVTKDNASISSLIDDLTKEVDPKDLEEIWTKAINAKPTLLAQIIGLVNSKYKQKNVAQQVGKWASVIDQKGQLANNRIGGIEQDLVKQRDQQKENISILESTFELYYNTFKELRAEYILLQYVKTNFDNQLAQFKLKDNTSIQAQKELAQYERVGNLIANKQLLIQKSLMQIVLVVDNNDTLIKSCQNMLLDIDNLILHSLPNIRSNLITIAIALRTEKQMLENKSIHDFDANQSLLASKITSRIGVQTEQLQGQQALRDANVMQNLVAQAEKFRADVKIAKENKQKDIDKASEIMNNASHELVALLKQAK